jgi:hypothetical protein
MLIDLPKETVSGFRAAAARTRTERQHDVICAALINEYWRINGYDARAMSDGSKIVSETINGMPKYKLQK